MLTNKQQKFCLEYLKDSNASRSYKEAYNCENMNNDTIRVKASQMLKKDNIRLTIESMRQETNNVEINTIKELKTFWLSVMNNKLDNEDMKISERLKASELLARSEGIFSETRRNEISNPKGTGFQLNIARIVELPSRS